MKIAKDDIYQCELLKMQADKQRNGNERDRVVLTGEEISQAKVAACAIVVGEIRQYLDKYFGYEVKLSALV